MGAVFSQMAWEIVSPALVATTCRLALPECLTAVLMTELVRLAETVHGPESGDSKSPLVRRLAPASGTLPATSLRSSIYTSPGVLCRPMSKIGRGAVPVRVTYCHWGDRGPELLVWLIDQLPTRQLS